jgi:hypothetical protein
VAVVTNSRLAVCAIDKALAARSSRMANRSVVALTFGGRVQRVLVYPSFLSSIFAFPLD